VKIAVDTNILARAVLQDDARQGKAAAKLLKEATLIAVSLPSLCELVWILRRGVRHRRGSCGWWSLSAQGCSHGTVAFQCNSALLGVRLPMAAILTGDAHIARDYAISREIEDSLPPIVELLQGVDASFRPVPHRSGSSASSAFQNADGYRVEFLTSNRGSDDYIEKPAKMPALGGAALIHYAFSTSS